jgi:predicted Zn-dependent peptidase
MPDRTLAPVCYPLTIPELIAPQIEMLPCGTELAIYASDSQSLVSVEMIFPFSGLETRKRQLERFTFKMLLEGTVSHTAKQLADAVSFLGASVEILHSPDYESVQISCLGRVLPEVLAIWKDMWENSTFPEKEWKTIQETTRQQNAINLQKTSYLAGSLLKETLYSAKVDYGYSFDSELLDSFSTDDFKACFSELKKTGPALLVMAGKISTDSIAQWKEWLHTFSGIGSKALWSPDAFPEMAGQVVWSEKADAQQASLRLGQWSIPKTHPDSPVWNLVLEIYGGYFGSRLMSNIREDKGWTYGVFSHRVGNLMKPYWLIGADIKGDVVKEALTEINKEAEILRNELVSEEELDLVKNYMAGQFLSSIPHCFGLADRYKSLWVYGISPAQSTENLRRIQEAGAAEVREIAAKYLWPEKSVAAISGKKQPI